MDWIGVGRRVRNLTSKLLHDHFPFYHCVFSSQENFPWCPFEFTLHGNIFFTFFTHFMINMLFYLFIFSFNWEQTKAPLPFPTTVPVDGKQCQHWHNSTHVYTISLPLSVQVKYLLLWHHAGGPYHSYGHHVTAFWLYSLNCWSHRFNHPIIMAQFWPQLSFTIALLVKKFLQFQCPTCDHNLLSLSFCLPYTLFSFSCSLTL